MPGTSPDKLGVICIELKMIGGHPVADFYNASFELTDHSSPFTTIDTDFG